MRSPGTRVDLAFMTPAMRRNRRDSFDARDTAPQVIALIRDLPQAKGTYAIAGLAAVWRRVDSMATGGVEFLSFRVSISIALVPRTPAGRFEDEEGAPRHARPAALLVSRSPLSGEVVFCRASLRSVSRISGRLPRAPDAERKRLDYGYA